MIRRHWKVWGICLVILAVYLNYKQHDMVVTWLKPGTDNISENAGWIYGKFSSGKVVHARECLEFAEGWDALEAIWPLSLVLLVLSLTAGIAGGYTLRGDDNADCHRQQLTEKDRHYQQFIEVADNKISQAKIMDQNSRQRFNEATQKQKLADQQITYMTKYVQEMESELTAKLEVFEKQLLHLQEDHKKRGQMVDRLKEEKTELKLENTALKKDKLLLAQENLKLAEENQTIKKNI